MMKKMSHLAHPSVQFQDARRCKLLYVSISTMLSHFIILVCSAQQ